ncbi:MAG TPA: formate dehydrogenase accessory sulfurtransferase FdhD [Eubacteriaceae bacterium]|nr:formate dehydrogenase accessory sulfurtransferase FdhD [Eubacteriaceae bacterium]
MEARGGKGECPCFLFSILQNDYINRGIKVEQKKQLLINRVKNNKNELLEDSIIVEYPLTIFLNNNEFVTLLCSPTGLEYLIIGFLISEGIIRNKEEIENIKIDEEKGHAYIDIKDKTLFAEKLFGKRTITTGCGKGTVFYNVLDSLGTKSIKNNFKIGANMVLDFSRQLNQDSILFLETGGVHSCALCDNDEIILFHEDVGRHNALDKIIGEALLRDIKLEDKILITSGRISSEMIIKTTKNGIPIVVSRSAPTDLAVKIAKQFNVTLIGFARGNRMNIYNGINRITM